MLEAVRSVKNILRNQNLDCAADILAQCCNSGSALSFSLATDDTEVSSRADRVAVDGVPEDELSADGASLPGLVGTAERSARAFSGSICVSLC